MCVSDTTYVCAPILVLIRRRARARSRAGTRAETVCAVLFLWYRVPLWTCITPRVWTVFIICQPVGSAGRCRVPLDRALRTGARSQLRALTWVIDGARVFRW